MNNIDTIFSFNTFIWNLLTLTAGVHDELQSVHRNYGQLWSEKQTGLLTSKKHQDSSDVRVK